MFVTFLDYQYTLETLSEPK